MVGKRDINRGKSIKEATEKQIEKDQPANLKAAEEDVEFNNENDSDRVKTEAEEFETNDQDQEESGEAALQWQQEKEELLDKIKRKQADIDNLRRISKLEQAEAREYALHEFLCRLLPVLDNIERGLEVARLDEKISPAYLEGLEMIRKQLMQILEQEEVTVIEAVGTNFDPQCHHAVMQVEDDQSEPGIVLEELQTGYRHRKRVLRPAMVKVCKE